LLGLLLISLPQHLFASAIARFYGRTMFANTGSTNPGLATGTPDGLYATQVSGNTLSVSNFVDASFTEATNGMVTGVWLISMKKVDAAFDNDQFNLRYQIGTTWGSTSLTEVPTNTTFQEANIWVTDDRTWTWANIKNMQVQTRYVRVGGNDGRQTHIDSIGIVVRTAVRCQGTSLMAANVSQGQPRIPVESVSMTSFNGGTTFVSAMRITRLGTSVNADVSQVYLYEDVNKNNLIDADDTLLGQSAVTANPQLVNFPTALSISAETKNIIVAYDVALTAVAGRTLGARVAATTDITIDTPNEIENVNFPMSSSLGTIRTQPAITLTFSAAPTSLLTGNAITLTGTVTNTGQTAAIELIPSAITINQVSGGEAIYAAGPTPTSRTLAAGATSNFSWTFAAQTSGIINFSGTVSWKDPNSGIASTSLVRISNNVTITTNPGSNGLTSFMQATPDRVNTNYSPVTLTMTVTNVSASPINNITPSAITLPGLAATNLTGPIPGNFATLNPSAEGVFTWTYQTQGTTGNLSFRGNALINGVNGSVLSNSNIVIVETPANLLATMTALPTTANVGSQIILNLAVRNTGMATAGMIIPPTNLTITGGNTTIISGPTPAVATLSQNAMATFSWTYQINAPAATNRTFSGSVTGQDMNSGGAVSSPNKSAVVTITTNVVPKWGFPAGTVTGGFNAVPTTFENVVIAGANDSKVYGIDINTGLQKWVFNTSGIILSPLVTTYDDALGKYLILVASQDNKVYCLIDNGTSVTQRWEAFYGGSPPAAFRAAPITDGTYVYIGGEDGFVRCLNLSNGAERAGWTNTNVGIIRSTTAVQDGFVLVGSAGNNRVYRLNADGTVHSSYLTGAPVSASPFLMNSRLYIVSNLLYCLNPSNLTELYWSYNFGSTSQSSPWFDFDTSTTSGPIIFGTENNYVRAVRDDGTGSTLVWSFLANGPVRTNPLAIDGKVYFGDATGRIYSLNSSNGTIRAGWPFLTGSAINSSAALNEDYTQIFIGSSNGKLYSFDVSQ
jgi:outer membrane protein assembly factor BamB